MPFWPHDRSEGWSSRRNNKLSNIDPFYITLSFCLYMRKGTRHREYLCVRIFQNSLLLLDIAQTTLTIIARLKTENNSCSCPL